ncbi:hypothetical protein CDEST_14297 [Colletotrichum destructivum]|uniref:Uncharacterized protein n=1 Tax=Colletotrichum destructivum TaxID=34406 RepID=A0AAX4J1L4_9PEZI|nr:hypothetical protein CDEST_14297 [Colletotrichum destructivum]
MSDLEVKVEWDGDIYDVSSPFTLLGSQTSTGQTKHRFQEGEAPSNAAKVPKAFFQELAEFLHLKNLADLVALPLLDGPRDWTKTELLVGPQGTLMMDTKDVLGFESAQITTSWFFQVGDDGVISCKSNDVYAAKKNTHAVFQDSKPLPTVEALKAVFEMHSTAFTPRMLGYLVTYETW